MCYVPLIVFQGNVRYQLVGDFPAPYFFKINEHDGRITVRKTLKADKATNYTVGAAKKRVCYEGMYFTCI